MEYLYQIIKNNISAAILLSFIFICSVLTSYIISNRLITFYKCTGFINLIRQYEKKNKSKILLIIDCELLKSTYIKDFVTDNVKSIEDVTGILKVIGESIRTKNKLHLIIHCTGGTIESSDIIMNVLLNLDNVTSYIPQYAYSAATFITFATSEIYINKFALLSPCDPQITVKLDDEDKTYSSSVLMEYINICKKSTSHNEILLLSALDAKISHLDNIRNMRRILKKRKINKKSHNEIINLFCSGKYPHSMPIFYDRIKQFNLHIKTDIPEEIQLIYDKFMQLTK